MEVRVQEGKDGSGACPLHLDLSSTPRIPPKNWKDISDGGEQAKREYGMGNATWQWPGRERGRGGRRDREKEGYNISGTRRDVAVIKILA